MLISKVWVTGVIVFLLVAMGIGVYFGIRGNNEVVEIEQVKLNDIKFMETDIFKGSTYVQRDQKAQNIFQKIINETNLASDRDYLNKKYNWESFQRKIDFTLKDGRKVTFKLLFVKKTETSGELYVVREGDQKIKHMDNEEAKEIVRSFSYECDKGVCKFLK
ncbi:hypothetical protein bcgnr5390_12580 [Bacillus luti]|nr:hypothetical protein BC2903_51260 [Bacillus cereus]